MRRVRTELTSRSDEHGPEPRRSPFSPRSGTWAGFEIEYRHRGTLYRCRIENPRRVEHGVAEVWLDGERVPEGVVPLRDDGREHVARIVMGETGK